MKLKELLETFIQTDKTFIAYYQAPYFIRMVKVPITSTVNALYASKTRYWDGQESYNFLSSSVMAFSGYIDCHNNLRFPSVELRTEMVEDPESFTTREGSGYCINDAGVVLKDTLTETPMQAVSDAVLREAKKLALQTPLPVYKEDATDKGRRLLFGTGSTVFPRTSYNFGCYIGDDSVIDMLSETEGWAEKIAKKWCASTAFAKYEDGQEKPYTNLDVLRKNLSYQNAIQKAFDKIINDPNDEIHQYIEMKKVVANTKTVNVVFKTESGHTAAVKVRSKAFSNSFGMSVYWISPYDVIPEGGKNRMESLLPTEVEKNTAGGILKKNIISIEYRGKKIWERKS